MKFSSPIDFLWLGPLIGAIAALWMLRMRRRDRTVSTLYLWRAVAPVTRADTPFQRLRRNLLLFLQLAAAFLLIFALAGPLVRAGGRAGAAYAIVIDNSGGMAADDVAPSRLTAARARARDFLARRFHPGDRVCVIATTPFPAVVQPWTRSAAGAADAIGAVQQTDVARNLVDDIRTATEQCRLVHGASERIEFFSDGAWPEAQDATAVAGAPPVDLLTAGGAGGVNAGIVSIDERPDLQTPDVERVFVRVFNASPAPLAGLRLTASVAGGPVFSAAAALAAGASVSETFPVREGPAAQVLTVKLSGVQSDILASDDVARIVVPADRRTRVLLVSSGSLFLERSLTADPNVDLYECSPQSYARVGAAQYDFAVFDGFAPNPLPDKNILVFDAVAPGLPVAPAPALQTHSAGALPVVDWSQTDALMRFVDLSAVHVADQILAAPLPEARVLAETDAGPILAASDVGGRRRIWAAFSLSRTDLALKPAFPIFMANAVDYLRDQPREEEAYPAGAPIPVPLPAGDWTLAGPSASSGRCRDNGDGCATSGLGTSRAGLYVLASGGQRRMVAVNVASVAASDTQPRQHPLLAHAAPATSRPQAARSDASALAGAVALLLLLAEWSAFHRPSLRSAPAYNEQNRI